MTEKTSERIAKRIARAGLCSRREAERWIEAGRVSVDGKLLESPAVNVVPGAVVTVDGKPIPEADTTRLWRFHKPTGTLTTNRDPQGRPTIFDSLPDDLPRVVTVGRLDFNSEGLLLLTNDGELARRLEHPETGWRRRYRVRVYGRPDEDRLAELARGLTIDGIRYGPVDARLEREKTSNAWLSISLTEGKNREVRRICEHIGLQVTRLIRVSFGPFQLGHLPRGEVSEVPKKALAEQLGSGGDRRGQRRAAHRR
ncbi:MAG: pseudouridine synthase [Rickettsiales bacterium]